ncbi:MAG TPA: TIGR04086 family membrane protein [Firmicutes bacterium]|jgi:putative membrane protein (TIGR04086 family)|nr:TIGR04086 family membrane protein [Bacillota bacterium]
MNIDGDETLFPVGAVVYGSLAAFLMTLIGTTFTAVFTELGWKATISWPNNSLYLLLLFVSIVIGSIMAGWRSRQKGWAAGIGVAVIVSLLWLILALLFHHPIHAGIYLVKCFISLVIGAFGGIIGVNALGGKG